MKAISYCNKIIEYSFYAIFFLVPLVFAGNTSELFEFNKMWLTFGLTIIIAAAWLSKMALQKKIFIQRTSLDIPVMLFLVSQIISSIFSLDPHISLWGYYSRFNGGLLSTFSYILLYYAFVSNLEIKHVLRTLVISLVSGLIVALWGLPSHFGYDPTCFVFRGTLNTDCWTDAFRPTVRIFSTLGQPDWLAAYLAVLIPLAIAYTLKYFIRQSQSNNQKQELRIKNQGHKSNTFLASCFLLLASLFYLDLIFTDTRAGFLAFWAANILFWIILFYKNILTKKNFFRWLFIVNLSFLLLNFFFGIPVDKLYQYTLPGIKSYFAAHSQEAASPAAQPTLRPPAIPAASSNGITDSGTIRLFVWRGALDAWKANPLFGTGVETFAFAYYKFRPAGHNMTSEWDYLYNKAHNEYLNYLATTGIFGLGSYIAFIGLFVFLFLKYLINSKSEIRNPKQIQNTNDKNTKRFEHSNFENLNLFRASNFEFRILAIALFSGWISILISNFFGFSVVIMNLYLFLIPAFVFMLAGMLNPSRAVLFSFAPVNLRTPESPYVNPYQWTAIFIIILAGGYLLLGLFRYWYADVAYALGYNLDHVNAYQQAYQHLQEAVNIEPGEPVYKDEFSVNLATIAAALFMQKDTANAPQVAKQAIALSDEITANHPNNVIFWKDRVKIFYTLAQGDSADQQAYLQQALQAMIQANELAPTDAKISYNLGVLYGQNGNIDQGIKTLTNTIALKPDYRDAYFALGLFYHEKAIDKNNKVIDPVMQQKAIAAYRYILQHLSPDDKIVKDALSKWGA